MIQRLFLNRVHAEAAGSPVRGQDDLILSAFAHEAQTLLPFLEFADPWTEVALDAAVIQAVPVLGGKSDCCAHRGFFQEVLVIQLTPTAFSILAPGRQGGARHFMPPDTRHMTIIYRATR